MREIGLSEGAQVGEQWVHLGAPDQAATALKVRRIRLKLPQPTRDGDDTLCLLTTLGAEHADALTLARLYRQRCTIERAFLHLTTQLRCEVRTLNYPGAALFALACAMTAFNVLAVLKAALRAAHSLEAEQGLSGYYYMAIEMGNATHSLDTTVDPEDWIAFRLASTAVMAAWLRMQAQRLNLARYRKSVRGLKTHRQAHSRPAPTPFLGRPSAQATQNEVTLKALVLCRADPTLGLHDQNDMFFRHGGHFGHCCH